jgi:alkanesulfonate monooxygenase SsuD/methylene tetrahydromethanopterin reductase-like flavin-dependent oxidoreductase (luciferase family)
VDFGAHLPLIDFGGTDHSLNHLRAYAQRASEMGFSHLCANDHLVFGRPWLDGPTALASVIDVSGGMTLATTVAVPVLRGPAATAKALGAIDILSGGRLVVGVGPGSSARDYGLIGIPFEERFKRLDEAIGAMRAYWAGEGATYEGAFYPTGGVELEPHPAQRPGPPIWIGSWGSAAGLRRVARLGDGWLASGYNTNPELFGKALNDLAGHLEAAGKSPAGFPNGIATMWTYVTGDKSASERILGEVLAPTLNRPADDIRELLPIGSPEECADRLRAYKDAGAERIFIWPMADEIEQLERFATDVIPLV